MFYTTEIIEIRVLLFFYVKARLSICLSVLLSFFLPLSFSACNLICDHFFFYFYKKDLMFAMFMHKYDQGQNFKYIKS